jgi:hypothetical protein
VGPGSSPRDPKRFDISFAARSEICRNMRSFMESEKRIYTLGMGMIARNETKDK